jgi:hypothetical protein
MCKSIIAFAIAWAAAGCGDESCFAPGQVTIDISGTFGVGADPDLPACRPQGEFLALPTPLAATIADDGTWSFGDPDLSVVLYPDDCLFTLVQGIDSSDGGGAYHDQLSYIALAHPAPDVWTGSGVLRRDYDSGAQCQNRIAGVTVTLTWQ